jgi:hypothetical protein
VLQNLRKEIRDCYQRAERCARNAETALTEDVRKDFLDLEKFWLNFARSYESAQQLLDLCVESGEKIRKLRWLMLAREK